MPLLRNWSVVGENHPYRPPEEQVHYLTGNIYEDSRFPEGHKVITSKIVASDGWTVTTKSGTTYQLGDPDPRYLLFLQSIGYSLDFSNPIKMLHNDPQS